MAIKTDLFPHLEQAEAIGIDVSKAQLSLAWVWADQSIHRQIDNQALAIQAFAQQLVASAYRGKIIIESTGHYHWLAILILSDHDQDVRLINPLMSSKHQRSHIRKTKTDPVDAQSLAYMGLTERRLPPRWRRSAQWVKLRHQVGVMGGLDKICQKLRDTLREHGEALADIGVLDDPLLAGFKERLRALDRYRKRCEGQLAQDLAGLDQATHARYRSVPGLSDYSAGLLVLFMNPEAQRSRSWVAFAGLDISARQSGVWTGRSKLSKRGNAYLRKKLFQAAWAAWMNDTHFKRYYRQLREQGRRHVESQLMIARKLLRIAFTLQRHQCSYDPTLAWQA